MHAASHILTELLQLLLYLLLRLLHLVLVGSLLNILHVLLNLLAHLTQVAAHVVAQLFGHCTALFRAHIGQLVELVPYLIDLVADLLLLL